MMIRNVHGSNCFRHPDYSGFQPAVWIEMPEKIMDSQDHRLMEGHILDISAGNGLCIIDRGTTFCISALDLLALIVWYGYRQPGMVPEKGRRAFSAFEKPGMGGRNAVLMDSDRKQVFYRLVQALSAYEW
jgi:hypothetical protein